MTRPTVAEVMHNVERLNDRLKELEGQIEKLSTSLDDTNDKVSKMFTALMVPPPGQSESRIDSISKITNNVDAAKITYTWVVKIAALIAAVGVIYSSFKLNIFNGGQR